MKRFKDEQGTEWTASVIEEDTPRHHGRFILVLRPAAGEGPDLILPEVRWQSAHSAERTLNTMGEFELRRRLRIALRRHDTPGGGVERTEFGDWKAGGPGTRGGARA